MKKGYLILVLILTGISVYGGDPTKKDSANKIIPYFVFDTYYSNIGGRGADVWGIKAGVEWKKQWIFSIGYNKLKADIIEYLPLPESEIPYAKTDSVKAQLYLRYYPVTAEYIFYNKDPWQLSTPLSLGYGRSYFQYFDAEEKSRDIYNHGVLMTGIGINAQYKILKWVGIGTGVGYRIMLVSNPEVNTNFNTPVFTIRINLYLGEIFKSLFPNAHFPD